MYSGNIIKKIIAILAAGALLMAASSCGVPEDSFDGKPDTAAVIEMAREITTGVSYAVTEPIYFNKQVKTEGEEDNWRLEYVNIYGLADTDVQDRINDELTQRAAAAFSAEAPAFEGLEEQPSFGTEANVLVRSYNTWNCNDIISIVTNKQISSESASVQYVDGVTIDLADGEELSLSDLFSERFDYLSVINEAVEEAIAEQWTMYDVDGELRSVSVEKRTEDALVDDDTPFFLDDRGVNIILKSDNPSISFSESREQTICIGFDRFGRNWTISGGCEPSLYEDPSATGYAMTYSGAEHYLTDTSVRDLDREDVWLYDALSYPADFPEELVSEAEAELQSASVNDEDALAFAKSGSVTWVSLNNEVSCFVLGDYYLIRRDTTDNILQQGVWETETVCRVYDQDLRELDFSELFASDWEYEPLFRQKLADLWALSYGATGFVLETGDAEELSGETLDDLMESSSFLLGPQGITLYTRSLAITGGDADAPYTYITPLSVYVPYAEIGLGHFALFGAV